MLPSLDSSASALEQFQQELNVLGNNIANVNTVGFKSANVNFADALSQTIGTDAAGSMQVGTGVVTSDITNDFSQGSISSTGVQTNMAINGNGFFLVKDPTTGDEYATQDGDFTVNASGYLVTSTGMYVQGYSDAGLTTLGNIQINNTGAPGGDTSAVSSYTFGSDGTLTVELEDGTQFTRGQVLLQNYTDPTQLISVGNNLYTGLTAANPVATSPAAPGSSGLGDIVTGSLEMSNVDLAEQLTDLITAQRAYEANTRVVTASDQILQDLTNLGR